jgi:hypothetical protein
VSRRTTPGVYLVTFVPAVGVVCVSYFVAAYDARSAGQIAADYQREDREPDLCLEVSAETVVALIEAHPKLFILEA